MFVHTLTNDEPYEVKIIQVPSCDILPLLDKYPIGKELLYHVDPGEDAEIIQHPCCGFEVYIKNKKSLRLINLQESDLSESEELKRDGHELTCLKQWAMFLLIKEIALVLITILTIVGLFKLRIKMFRYAFVLLGFLILIKFSTLLINNFHWLISIISL